MISLYPQLSPLIEHLHLHEIAPIFVGGCVRDYLLRQTTEDIDIELYHAPDHEALLKILSCMGKINLVGKSFGIYKLSYRGLNIDFSLPRTEQGSGNTHRDFIIQTYRELDFSSAARRRDFTINAIGFDPKTNTLLDPFDGQNDLALKRLRCVDSQTFVEDPLRPLRAVQFAARYHLECDPLLLGLCRDMIRNGALETLPKERIFEEIKKLFILSDQPSIGLRLLEKMGAKNLLCDQHFTWEQALERCDRFAADPTTHSDLALLLASVLAESTHPSTLLRRLSDERSLIRSTMEIITHFHRYGRFEHPPLPILQGRDLTSLGLTPSPRFKTILSNAYDAQNKGIFHTHAEAVEWLKDHLVTLS